MDGVEIKINNKNSEVRGGCGLVGRGRNNNKTLDRKIRTSVPVFSWRWKLRVLLCSHNLYTASKSWWFESAAAAAKGDGQREEDVCLRVLKRGRCEWYIAMCCHLWSGAATVLKIERENWIDCFVRRIFVDLSIELNIANYIRNWTFLLVIFQLKYSIFLGK